MFCHMSLMKLNTIKIKHLDEDPMEDPPGTVGVPGPHFGNPDLDLQFNVQ